MRKSKASMFRKRGEAHSNSNMPRPTATISVMPTVTASHVNDTPMALMKRRSEKRSM
ncbi:hypothetical protein D3C87_1855750 [compost metagenome]